MSSAPAASVSSPSPTVPREEYEALQAQVHDLKSQLEWFKRQLFGSKSEKRRVLDPAIQADLLARLAEAPAERPAPPTEQITYTRRKAKERPDACLTEQGLRFDETVPVEVIELPAPELSGAEADRYIVIDKKITRRLAQRPGSYVVLEYHRPVVKHLPSQTLSTVGAPGAYSGEDEHRFWSNVNT
jgi:transposase